MTQFNLLPDVKLQYIKAEQTRRLVMAVSILVSVVALAGLLTLYSLNVIQNKHLSDLNKDIKSETAAIQKQPDLNKVLSIQNQLSGLTALHSAKPAASCLASYLNQVTPATANINNFTITFGSATSSASTTTSTGPSATVTGTADSLATVNQYVDTLKFTTYTEQPAKQPGCINGQKPSPAPGSTPTDPKTAFSAVVLSSFGLTTHEATYTITFNYDPSIFDNTQAVTLTVPKQVTTRSQLGQPKDLFALPVDSPTKGKAQ